MTPIYDCTNELNRFLSLTLPSKTMNIKMMGKLKWVWFVSDVTARLGELLSSTCISVHITLSLIHFIHLLTVIEGSS